MLGGSPIAPYDLVSEDSYCFRQILSVKADAKPGPSPRAEDVDPTS